MKLRDGASSAKSDEIAALSRNLTVYVNSNDRALLLSAWLNQSRRLGRRSPEEPSQLDEMMDMGPIEVHPVMEPPK